MTSTIPDNAMGLIKMGSDITPPEKEAHLMTRRKNTEKFHRAAKK